MRSALEARIRAIEKKSGAENGERRGYTLEQIIRLAQGQTDVGPPERVVAPGEKLLEELISEAAGGYDDAPTP